MTAPIPTAAARPAPPSPPSPGAQAPSRETTAGSPGAASARTPSNLGAFALLLQLQADDPPRPTAAFTEDDTASMPTVLPAEDPLSPTTGGRTSTGRSPATDPSPLDSGILLPSPLIGAPPFASASAPSTSSQPPFDPANQAALTPAAAQQPALLAPEFEAFTTDSASVSVRFEAQAANPAPRLRVLGVRNGAAGAGAATPTVHWAASSGRSAPGATALLQAAAVAAQALKPPAPNGPASLAPTAASGSGTLPAVGRIPSASAAPTAGPTGLSPAAQAAADTADTRSSQGGGSEHSSPGGAERAIAGLGFSADARLQESDPAATAATAASPPTEQPSSEPSAALMDSLIQRLEQWLAQSAQAGLQSTRFTVQTEGWAPIGVSLSLRDGELQLRLDSDEDPTRQALREGIDSTLKPLLDAHGLRLASAEVRSGGADNPPAPPQNADASASAEQPDTGSAHGGSGQGDAPTGSRPTVAATSASASATRRADTATPPRARPAGVLDLFA